MNQCHVLNWPPSFSGTTYGCTCTCFGHLHLFNFSWFQMTNQNKGLYLSNPDLICFKISLNLELSASFRKHRHEDKGRWCIRQSELDRPKFWKWNEVGYIIENQAVVIPSGIRLTIIIIILLLLIDLSTSNC